MGKGSGDGSQLIPNESVQNNNATNDSPLSYWAIVHDRSGAPAAPQTAARWTFEQQSTPSPADLPPLQLSGAEDNSSPPFNVQLIDQSQAPTPQSPVSEVVAAWKDFSQVKKDAFVFNLSGAWGDLDSGFHLLGTAGKDALQEAEHTVGGWFDGAKHLLGL